MLNKDGQNTSKGKATANSYEHYKTTDTEHLNGKFLELYHIAMKMTYTDWETNLLMNTTAFNADTIQGITLSNTQQKYTFKYILYCYI